MAPTTISHALVLPIAPAHWPPPRAAVEIDGVQLEPKAELHVTLVGRALGAELHAPFGDRADALVAAARDAHDWALRSAERCVGQWCVSTCRSRRSTYHHIKNKKQTTPQSQ